MPSLFIGLESGTLGISGKNIEPNAIVHKAKDIRAIKGFFTFVLKAIQRHSQATFLSKLVQRRKMQVVPGMKQLDILHRDVNKSRLL